MKFAELLCLFFGHRYGERECQLCVRCKRWTRPTWDELRRQQE